MGIKASGNLMNSKYVLLVEGEHDANIFKLLLPHLSDQLRSYLRDGVLSIKALNGASRLPSESFSLKSLLCFCVVFLDNDSAAREAAEKAEKDASVAYADIYHCNCPGMKESELEDCFNVDIYRIKILEKWGVDLNDRKFRNNYNKWSSRIRDVFCFAR
ncbi:hypothetical protein [Carnimonas bestiolae]|uniref:hypothetical protein n=1 Tax=Carnimonas bestiolae TaxID=3402172 RepID=UPI003F4ACBC6